MQQVLCALAERCIHPQLPGTEPGTLLFSDRHWFLPLVESYQQREGKGASRGGANSPSPGALSSVEEVRRGSGAGLCKTVAAKDTHVLILRACEYVTSMAKGALQCG